MMSVAYIATSYPPAVGGVQAHAHGLLKELAAVQRQWVVSQWDTNRTDWLLGSTVRSPWHPTDYVIDGVAVRRFGFELLDRVRMLPAVPAFYVAPWAFSPWLGRVFRRRLAPLVAGADLIHAFRIGRENLVLAALREARRRGIPFVFTPTHHPRWVGYRYTVFRRIYREADRLIALTEAERDTLASLGVPEDRIRVTGNGPTLAVEADAASIRERYALDGNPVVLFLGQKYAYKGLDLLLGAAPLVWAKCREARFLFVGPRTAYSRRLFAAQRDARIIETGTLSLEEKTSALAACTVLALPSRQESFGGVFTEAWSFDKPVIGGRIPAIESVIADGEDGFTCPHQPPALAERLVALLSDPALATRMGRAGHDKVRRHYTWPVLARKTHDVYREVLGVGPATDGGARGGLSASASRGTDTGGQAASGTWRVECA